MIIDLSLVTLRDFIESDIPFLADYAYRSPPGFQDSIGIDINKQGPESDFREKYRKHVEDNSKIDCSKMNVLTIIYKNKPIGVNLVNQIEEGKCAIFHAHIWFEKYRRQGICTYTYPNACEILMYRFDLRHIFFKTPSQNSGAIKVKEKLGLKCIGEEPLKLPLTKDGIIAKVYKMDREQLAEILAKRSVI